MTFIDNGEHYLKIIKHLCSPLYSHLSEKYYVLHLLDNN